MVDYEKLLNLDYTAYDHYRDFQEKLEEHQIGHPSITVEKGYGDTPEVVVIAKDVSNDSKYIDVYCLEDVTEEEFEEVMFDTWKTTMKELEP